MTPEQLKASIIQAALEGKLTQQMKEDTPVSVTLNEIQKLRNAMIKNKEIKKVDVLPIDDTVPFDIPDSWQWIRIGSIEEINLGFTYRPEYTEEGVYFLSVKDISGGKIDFQNAKKVSQETYDNAAYGSKPRKGDILFGRVGTMGKPQIIDVDEPFCIFVSLGFFRDHTNIVIKEYISLWMQSFLFDKQVDQNVKGSAQRNLNTGWLKDFYIPFPPIEEQRRIVAKIEELLPFVDRYAASYEKLEQFNAKFPEDMKKSILQYAIQGKLVEQRPEEGTAGELYNQICIDRENKIKAKLIKRDKRASLDDMEEEKPFDIPENWKWVTLGSILLKLTDGTHKTPKYSEQGIKFVSVKDMSSGVLSLDNTKFITEEEHKELYNRCDPQKGDMLLSKVGTTGVPAIIDTDEQFSLFVSVALLKYNHEYINEKYLYYLLLSPLVQKQASENTRGVGNKNWVLDAIGKTLITLPPYKEQERIVEELEKLLPYCDQLIK